MTSAIAGTKDELAFSGFARVVGGQLSTNEASYANYDNSWSFSEDSLIALQADYAINTQFSISAQGILHSGSDRDSGLDWLYLTYQPSSSWQFNVGRLRIPVLNYSDVIDVGFSYPWVNAPEQVYSRRIFYSGYEGLNVRYQTHLGNVGIGIEGYWGDFDGEVFSGQEAFEVDINDIYGAVFSLNYKGFQFRSSIARISEVVDNSVQIDQLVGGLTSAGFDELASKFRLDDGLSVYVFGAGYISLDWFVNAEAMSVDSDLDVLSGITSYYLTVGRYYNSVLFHATIARSRQDENSIENTIPVGVSPLLDVLSTSVDTINALFPTDDLDSLTLGLRWDYNTHLAFKTEVSFLKGKEGKTSLFYVALENADFDRRASLYQVGVEWVF
ncbi:hypothetical protein Q4561_09895 [Alteromonas sp. 1_MG-2023]|uniref:hypothetical protein n=1 Tax=Alteromonas sp. 1_MG-2023 TaxID=3062669 RepID=UPI0026E3EFD9|nr:hypothetical protein [Alteromonas sp. 1_MG-2023]MDO6567370.1 hypothetical protein [Alteromonas sp. 1_MG-2023]